MSLGQKLLLASKRPDTDIPFDDVLAHMICFVTVVIQVIPFVSNSYSSSYADDNTLYAFGYNLEEIKNTLRFDFDLVSKWFEETIWF